MQYIKLGTTGMDVSPIAIGAMTYGESDLGHPVWSKGEHEVRPLIKRDQPSGSSRGWQTPFRAPRNRTRLL